MLNSVAVLYVRWLVGSTDPVVLRDTAASAPRTAPLPEAGRLPELVGSVPPLHLGFVVLLVTCGLVWFVLKRTTFGFEVRTVGTNPNAARYAGMGVNRTIVLVMAMSGALAGLAGAGEVSGTSGYLSPGRVRGHRLRLHRHRPPGPGQPVRHHPHRRRSGARCCPAPG